MFKLHFGYHPDYLTGSGVPLIQLSEMAPQYVLAIALQIIYTHYTQYVLTYPEPACCPAVSDSFKKVWGVRKEKEVTGIISERVWCFIHKFSVVMHLYQPSVYCTSIISMLLQGPKIPRSFRASASS